MTGTGQAPLKVVRQGNRVTFTTADRRVAFVRIALPDGTRYPKAAWEVSRDKAVTVAVATAQAKIEVLDFRRGWRTWGNL